jgi:hypothetical protein
MRWQSIRTYARRRAEIAPDGFFARDDGLDYVTESAANLGTGKLSDGKTNQADGAESRALPATESPEPSKPPRNARGSAPSSKSTEVAS